MDLSGNRVILPANPELLDEVHQENHNEEDMASIVSEETQETQETDATDATDDLLNSIFSRHRTTTNTTRRLMQQFTRIRNRTAVVYFTGKDRKDTILTLSYTDNQYFAHFVDKEIYDHIHKYTFNTYSELCEYIDLVFENILEDDDMIIPFTHIQWDIPGFTSTIIDIENADEVNKCRLFHKLLNFYMHHTSNFL